MEFRREIRRFDATMIVVGGIVGAGIFINPYIVAQRLDTGPLVLAAWAAGGIVAIAGALTFAELGALFPQAGGHYAYLRRAYHPLAGFLYGWGLLLMIETGAIAAVSMAFAEYLLRALGRGGGATTPIAVLAILLVAGVNYFGVKPGSRFLNVLVVLKVAVIAALIAAGLWLPLGGAAGAAAGTGVGAVEGVQAAQAAATAGTGGAATVAARGFLFAFGGALVPVMFSYGGWQNANYVAEEMRDPRRDMPVALVVGVLIVILVYGLLNWIYLRTLGHAGLAGTMTPAADTARQIFGDAGDRLIAGAIALSTFGFLELTMLAPTRVYYAMARDGVFLERVARLHPRFRSPSTAIAIQAGWAVLLALTGTYAGLVDYVVFADWIFFGLAGASLFVFRRTHPVGDRDPAVFRTPGYPFMPGLFVLVALWIVMSVVRTSPAGTLLGAALLASGVPAFLWWRRAAARRRGEGAPR